MNQKLFIQGALAGLMALALPGHAAGLTQVTPCTKDSVSITAAAPSALGIPNVAITPAIQATGCYGVMSGNSGPLEDADPNLGYLEDGLLNGEKRKGEQYIDPYEFLTMVGGDVPQDLDGDGSADDPGWIHLGSMQGSNGELSYADAGPNDELNLGSVLKFVSTSSNGTSGTWKLDVDKNIKQLLEAAGILNRSTFDHLAFVIKSGNENSGGGWAVYDFNFNPHVIGGFDLSQPYNISGEWNTDDFGGHAISHMSIWARDPITARTVPAPGSLALLGLGLVLAGLRRR